MAGSAVFAFLASAGAIVPLAAIIGRATEDLAARKGPRVGGFLNASLANIPELIISVFLIAGGQVAVVKASLIGSILGNLLLVLGLSFLAGGLRHREQSFNPRAAGVHSTSLTLAVIGLLMPALFALTGSYQTSFRREPASVAVAAVLVTIYVAAMVFSMITHQDLLGTEHADSSRPASKQAMFLLAGASLGVALESEILVHSLDPALASLGLSKLFAGLIVIPIIGNVAEHASAVRFAMANKMNITMEIAIGSSTQVALFVAPVLVFGSLILGHPMDFVFTAFEVAAVGLAILIASFISLDGKSNWLEGAQLLGAYLIIAVSFFFVPAS